MVSRGETSAFLFFHVAGGIVGLPLVFSSIVASREMSKHPTLLNYCATWLFSSIIYTLLLFSGKQRDNPPPYSLCVAQASMVNGALPMTSAAGLALVAHIWHSLGPSRPWSTLGLATHKLKLARLVALLVLPYAVFLVLTVTSAVVGHTNPERVTSQTVGFYCTIDDKALKTSMATLTISFISVFLLLEVMICVKVYANVLARASIRQSGSLLFWLRMAGFLVYAILTLIVTALILSKEHSPAPYILQSMLPFIVFIFLATQKEVLSAWRGFLFADRVGVRGPEGHAEVKSIVPRLEDGQLLAPDVPFVSPELSSSTNIRGTSFVAHSTVPADLRMPRRPKRPAHTGLSGLSGLDFFGKTKRESKGRANTKKYLNLRSHGESSIPPVPQLPLPQMVAPIFPYDASSASAGHDSSTVTTSSINITQVHNIAASRDDSQRIIEIQKETITRLLEEVNRNDKIVEQLKVAENALHKTQNELALERRETRRLRKHANRIEMEAQAEKTRIESLTVTMKEIEIKNHLQEEELTQLKLENHNLSDALQRSVKSEKQWESKWEMLKSENGSLKSSVKALTEERDVLLDIWSTLESPVDWELQRNRGKASHMSPQLAYPELARKMIQRASTPGISKERKNMRHTRLQANIAPSLPSTSGSSGRSMTTSIGGVLDRLRPKMLEVNGKFEHADRLAGLEELVREQADLIQQLESVLNGHAVENMLHDIEGSLGSWSVPRSISSSMVGSKDSDLSRT